MFGVEWRNFKRHLTVNDMKDQYRINKKMCDYIYYLQTEIMQLKNEVKRSKKERVATDTDDVLENK